MTLEEIIGEINTLPTWKAQTMCAAAAERVAPLFRRFGRAASQPTFEATLDRLWTSVGSPPVRLPRAALRRLPEARQDDSHALEYWAGLALEVLVRAADHAVRGDAGLACGVLEAMASHGDGLDTTFTSAPGQTFRYDPKHPPPPGEIETQELRAQAELLTAVRHARVSDSALIASIRERARAQAAIYASAATRLASS